MIFSVIRGIVSEDALALENVLIFQLTVEDNIIKLELRLGVSSLAYRELRSLYSVLTKQVKS